MEPLSGRSSNRISERELERIPARLIAPRCQVSVKLWDYSPFGFAFLYNHSIEGDLRVKEGEIVVVALDVGGEKLEAECAVENMSLYRGCLRIGLSRRDLRGPLQLDLDPSGAQTPGAKGLELSNRLGITAEAANPILYGEWSPLSFLGVQPGLRLSFLSHDPSLLIFPGQTLDVELGLPVAGDKTYRGKVASVGRQNESAVAFVLEPLRFSDEAAHELANVLAREAGVGEEALRAQGFPTLFFRDRLDIRFAESEDDFSQVLQLQRKILRAAGAEAAELPGDAAGKRDRRSRMLCAFHDGALVAKATLTFPESDRMVLRTQAAFPGEQLPCVIPEKTDLVEITGVCLHPEHRGEDLLPPLFEHIARAFILSGRKHMLRLVDESLWPHFRRLGFRKMGAACERNGRTHHLIKLDAQALLSGRHMGAGLWSALYGNMLEDMVEKGLVALPAGAALRVGLLAWLKPMIKRLTARGYGELLRGLAAESSAGAKARP